MPSRHPPSAPRPDDSKPKLLEEVRQKLRLLHFAKRTAEAYVGWIHRFLLHCRDAAGGTWVHPSHTGDAEINAFLTSLAVERNVAASTQNQALSALNIRSSDAHSPGNTCSRRES